MGGEQNMIDFDRFSIDFDEPYKSTEIYANMIERIFNQEELIKSLERKREDVDCEIEEAKDKLSELNEQLEEYKRAPF